MNGWHIPWLEIAILLPLVGSFWVRSLRDPDMARQQSLIVSGLSLLCACAAWLSLSVGTGPGIARDQWDVTERWLGHDIFVIDELSAPLLPLTALLFLLTELATLRTKVQRFSFASALASEAIVLATLACKQPWVIIALLAAGTIPPALEIRDRKKPTRVFAIHMALFVGLLVVGQAVLTSGGDPLRRSPVAAVLLMAAVLIRSGIVPLHCWMTDLFEHGSFGRAILFVTPMVGAYAAVRLVLPIAPDWVMRTAALLSLVTAVYAAGMALVQHEARRFFCYVFLSHSSLVLVGMEVANTLGLTGALCVWISVGLSLAGFGLTLRCVEHRTGRLSLDAFHGLYEHMPMLAILFLITGLGSIGFPGTLGFVGTEVLLEGVVRVYPLVGTAIVFAAALNGLAILHAYFRVFTGTTHTTSIDLQIRTPEKIAVLVLTALILGGGLFPQPGVASRYHAAVRLVEQRTGPQPATDHEAE